MIVHPGATRLFQVIVDGEGTITTMESLTDAWASTVPDLVAMVRQLQVGAHVQLWESPKIFVVRTA